MDYVTSTIVVVVLACTCTIMHAISRKRNDKFPPGPSFLTIMIKSLELYMKPQQTMAKLAKRYGPIMLFKIGQSTTIVISSADAVKEIFHTHDTLFSDRTNPDVITSHDHNRYSLIFLPVSPLWQELRKICHSNLFSTKTLHASQGLRRTKLHELLGGIHQTSLNGEAVDVGRAAFMACINFLSYTFMSQDFVPSVGDCEFKHIARTLLNATGTANLVDYLPVLRIFDPQGIRRNTTIYIDKLFHVLEPFIDQRIKLREGKHCVRYNDMLDFLLDISEGNSQTINKNQIKHLFLDLLVAGTDTTAEGLEKAMRELMQNPEAMSKAKKELEEIVGIGNPVEESDIARLPYLDAVIKESLRMHPPAPLLVPRRAKIDVEVCGYTVPQGAQILINEWAIGRDPTIWENAHVFSPERFLGSEIDLQGRHFQFTPFGSGRRMCPGSPLAVRMLHVMLGSLINCFDWKLENDVPPQDTYFGQPLRAIPVMIIKNK